MNKPQPITKGEYGWKNRRAELLIIEVMDRATVPHCKYRMWQKLQHKITISADMVGTLMMRLTNRDHLILAGIDDEGEQLYKALNQQDQGAA